MKRWQGKAERGSAGLIRLLAWLAKISGRRVCWPLLLPIALYFVATDALARHASREFLDAALGRPARWRDVVAHVHAFAVTLLDRVYLASGQFDRFRITVEGDALVRKALATGRGCVLLGSHLGSFDLLMLANQALAGHPVNALMHLDPHSRVRRLAGIDDGKLNVIPLGHPGSLLRAWESLERGEVVAALADRSAGAGACLQAGFLGRRASFPVGPHVLAARAAAPVLMCFGLYEGGARYRIEFVEFGPAAAADSRGSMLQETVDRYAGLLEQYARRYPRNWFNFYPYWKQP